MKSKIKPKGNHLGDCSIWRSPICDCGEFRRVIRVSNDSDFFVQWSKHQASIAIAATLTDLIKAINSKDC